MHIDSLTNLRTGVAPASSYELAGILTPRNSRNPKPPIPVWGRQVVAVWLTAVVGTLGVRGSASAGAAYQTAVLRDPTTGQYVATVVSVTARDSDLGVLNFGGHSKLGCLAGELGLTLHFGGKLGTMYRLLAEGSMS